MDKTKILVVVAHPDDEVLGCGGTIARFASEGSEVYSLILGEGMASRGRASSRQISQLRSQAKKAGRILGVKDVYFHDYPDNKFDTVPLLDIVKTVENIKDRIRPEIIFTHYGEDLNIDHKMTYRAVITSTRPMVGEPVKQIYSFEVLSSTEWAFPVSFAPDAFFDISRTLENKLEALSVYTSELRDPPHPRSLRGVKISASYRGMTVGLPYAEAFKNVRTVR